MKFFLYSLIILLLGILPNINIAQDYVIPLWENNAQNIVDEATDSEYFYSVLRPEISVYLSTKRSATGQAILIIPGGGYHKVTFRWEGTDVAKWLNANGIAGIVLKYRLPNIERDSQSKNYPLLDARKAIKIIRKNANKWNISKEKIGVMGFSAGGHLASMLGTIECKNKSEHDTANTCPNFMILMYPVITMDEKITESGSKENLIGRNPPTELIEYYSTDKQISSKTPETFIVHASDDNVVNVKNSILFYEALIRNAVGAEMHIYQNGGHGFSLANGKGYLSSWRNRCLDWLKNIQ